MFLWCLPLLLGNSHSNCDSSVNTTSNSMSNSNINGGGDGSHWYPSPATTRLIESRVLCSLQTIQHATEGSADVHKPCSKSESSSKKNRNCNNNGNNSDSNSSCYNSRDDGKSNHHNTNGIVVSLTNHAFCSLRRSRGQKASAAASQSLGIHHRGILETTLSERMDRPVQGSFKGIPIRDWGT